MTKQEFLSELERALGKLPHAEVEQAIAFYDEAISDRMEDGLSEAEAVADLGPVDEIAAQIAAETPPIPRAIARANTGSRTLNIVLLAAFSPIWIPIVLALAAAALAVYVAIWAVIAALWAVDAVLVLMPFAGLAALASTLGGGMPLPGVFVFGLSLVSSGFGLVASFAVFWASKLLFRATRSFARWIASLFVRVSGKDDDGETPPRTRPPMPRIPPPTTPPSRKEAPAMRKAPKIILITAAALIGTGTVLSCGAWAVAGFDTARLSTVNYDWHKTVSALEDEATSPHKSIVITSEFENVLLEPADGDAIELEYWTGNCQSVSVEDTDGVLKIDVDSQPMEGVMIDLSPAEAGGVDDTTTVVRVPASFTGEIEVHSDSGDVVAINVRGLAGLRASNSNGDVVAKNVSAAKLDAINENGDTLLSGVEAEAVLATNFNGDISLGGAAARKAQVVNENGDIMLVDMALQDDLLCESVNGDISAQRLDITASRIESANGDVYLSYLGAENSYHIDAHTTQGDIVAPRGADDAARTIGVTSNLGDIQINFTSK